jgi:uncharacterized protein
MAFIPLGLTLLSGRYAICRLDPVGGVPAWAMQGEMFSITRTPDELSVVVPQERVPAGVRGDPGWRCFRVDGPMPLASVGVLASLAGPLGQASVSLFAVSTHDTDYILVKEEAAGRARQALGRAGHTVRE